MKVWQIAVEKTVVKRRECVRKYRLEIRQIDDHAVVLFDFAAVINVQRAVDAVRQNIAPKRRSVLFGRKIEYSKLPSTTEISAPRQIGFHFYNTAKDARSAKDVKSAKEKRSST